MIIGLHGSISEGKDTVANLLIEKLPKFENRKFAAKLKQIVGILTGVDPINFENEDFKNTVLPEPWKHPVSGGRITYRFLLIHIGTELFRTHFDYDIWANSLLTDYKENDKFLITDLRFKNEYEAIKNKGGITVLVRRFQKVADWLNSKNFEGVLSIPTHEFIKGYFNGNNNLIWKQELVTKLQLCDNINVNHPNWKKLIHESERNLYDERNNIKPYDYLIDNNSTLEDLQEKVYEVAKEIKKKFL